jgi:hypothetical protein
MFDYKQRAGQKQRLTVKSSATCEDVAQALGFMWGAWSEQPRTSRCFAVAALGLFGGGKLTCEHGMSV